MGRNQVNSTNQRPGYKTKCVVLLVMMKTSWQGLQGRLRQISRTEIQYLKLVAKEGLKLEAILISSSLIPSLLLLAFYF